MGKHRNGEGFFPSNLKTCLKAQQNTLLLVFNVVMNVTWNRRKKLCHICFSDFFKIYCGRVSWMADSHTTRVVFSVGEKIKEP